MFWKDQTSLEFLSGFYKKLGEIILCFEANKGDEIVEFPFIGNETTEEISGMVRKSVLVCFTTSGNVTTMSLA